MRGVEKPLENGGEQPPRVATSPLDHLRYRQYFGSTVGMGLTREDAPSSPLTPSSSTSFDSERTSIETQRPARPIRSSHDYDTEDDDSEDLIYATSDVRRPSGHKATPSTSRLLDATGGDCGEPASPQEERKQQELRRAYELGDEGEGSYGAASRPRGALQAVKGFFARNNGQSPPMPLSRSRITAGADHGIE